jgi:hypothetical protein
MKKIYSLCVIVLGMLFFVSCKKEAQEGRNTDQPYQMAGNHLKFRSTKDYVSITGNPELEQAVTDFTTTNHLAKMANSQHQDINARMTPTYSDTTDEDPDDLYPEYLQNILNDDSVVQIGRWLMKIDLVNDMGFVIDISQGDAYERLKNSTPLTNDRDVMTFGQDEEVLDVLDWIDKGQGTYQDYEDQKWGFNNVPIFCFDNGAKSYKDKQYYDYDKDDSKVRMKVELTYQKAIIYFRLFVEAKTQKKKLFLWVADGQTSMDLSYNYKWVQRCKKLSGSDLNTMPNQPGPKAQKVAYESAKSLRQYDMYAQVSIHRIGWPYFQIFTSGTLHIEDGY